MEHREVAHLWYGMHDHAAHEAGGGRPGTWLARSLRYPICPGGKPSPIAPRKKGKSGKHIEILQIKQSMPNCVIFAATCFESLKKFALMRQYFDNAELGNFAKPFSR